MESKEWGLSDLIFFSELFLIFSFSLCDLKIKHTRVSACPCACVCASACVYCQRIRNRLDDHVDDGDNNIGEKMIICNITVSNSCGRIATRQWQGINGISVESSPISGFASGAVIRTIYYRRLCLGCVCVCGCAAYLSTAWKITSNVTLKANGKKIRRKM